MGGEEEVRRRDTEEKEREKMEGGRERQRVGQKGEGFT